MEPWEGNALHSIGASHNSVAGRSMPGGPGCAELAGRKNRESETRYAIGPLDGHRVTGGRETLN